MHPSPRSHRHGKAAKVTPPPGDRVDLTADLLEADDPVAEQVPVARLPQRGVLGDHLPFLLRMETTTPVPKSEDSGTSSMNRVPSMTCAGASVWVVQCMDVVTCWDSTPDLAW
jgi:hypothetical protein